MSNWMRAAVASFALAATVVLPVTAVRAGNASLVFPPPPGMTLTTGKPTNRLMLHVAKVHLDAKYMRQVVPFQSDERPGTLIVNTGEKFLYLILGQGKALRYGIGVAREGFEWNGVHSITRKAEWPSWTPPAEMRLRKPGLPDSMPGGMDNPLGARALYIGATLYRIHGTNEPWTIGGNVSSGCIRMVNDDVIDLFARVTIGAKVVVL